MTARGTKVAAGRIVWLLVLALPASVGAGPQQLVEIQVTGEYQPPRGYTPELAGAMALLDARRRAAEAVAERIGTRADVQAQRLAPERLAAYLVPLVEMRANEPVPGPSVIQVRGAARIDESDLSRRVSELHRDQDVAHELVSAWERMRRMHGPSGSADRITPRPDMGASPDEQRRLAAAIDVQILIAQGYAALARTEPVTVGGRATPAQGLERARRLADAALSRAPDIPEARYLLGDVLTADGQPAAAEAEYRRALTADRPSSAGRTKLAASLRDQGKLDDAVAELREALRLDPAFARAHSDLGMILREQRQLPEAIAAYREATRLDPDLIDAHNGLAVSLAYSGKLEEAVQEFREILRVDPDSTIGYYNLAYALADLDRDVESAAAFREVVRINPNHYNARYNLGELYRLEEKYDDSAAQFREYLRLAPDTPQNRRNITRARGFIRQFEDPDAPPVAETMAPRRQP